MRAKKRISIGVEGKALGKTQDGLYNVTCHLLNEMARFDDLDFVVFSPYDHLPLELTGRVRHVNGGLFKKKPGVWFYFGLPLLLQENPVDVFWEPRQVLPFGLPRETRTVMTVHDLAFMRYPETLSFLGRKNLERNCRRSVRIANMIVTVSDFTAREILATGLADSSQKMRTIHNGVDESEFFPDPVMPSRHNGFDFSRPYFLFVGSIEPRKNLELLLSAFEKLPLGSPDLVVVYGNTWKSGVIIERILKGPASTRIHLLHNVPPVELRRLYSHAEALVMPSLYEGFGLPVLEAMACACPVLVSDIPVFKEVAGEAGMFFPNEPESLEKTLKWQVAGGLRETMISRGLEQVKKFSWKKSAQEMLDVFSKVIEHAKN